MERRILVAVFCAAFVLCALVTKPRATSWNDVSRLATIDALVRSRTFALDDSPLAAKTADKYRFRGHTYSDKPPALALQGAAVAAVLAPFGITLARRTEPAIYLITLFTVGLWFALGCAYAFAFQRLLGAPRGPAVLVAALTGLGTLALPYATVLANHVPAGAAGLAGIYHLVRAREGRAGAAALGALFLTLAYAFDAAAVVFGLAAVVLLWGASARVWAAFAVACVPVVAAQLAYDASVSTGWGPPAINQQTWSDPSSRFHRADQSLFPFDSAGGYLRYLAYVVVGAKGLISYTPLVLLCGYGFARLWRAAATRGIATAIVVTCAVYFVLLVAFTNDYGALNYGERRYVDIFFVLGAGLGPAIAAFQSGAAALAARLAVTWSIVFAMLGVVAPFGEPRGVSGSVFALQQLERLAHRAPLQVVLDAVALAVTIFLVQRFWSSAAVPTPGSGRSDA